MPRIRFIFPLPRRQSSRPAGTYNSSQSVAISDITPNTTIYYAINAVPTTSSTPYTGTHHGVNASETIEAIAAGPNNSSSTVASAAYTILPPAAAPTFNPPAGTYDSQQSVAISDATPNTTIYYAINAVPTTSSTPYTGPITVSANETIEAIAAGPNNANSPVASAAYTILLPAAAPAFNPPAATYNSSQSVTISDITPNTTVYYAINAVPTTSSTPYTGPITVSASETVNAIAAGPNNPSSTVASAAYTILLPAAAPAFNPPAGTYTSSQSVAITDSTPGATIYYAINAAPTTSSTPYTVPIAVGASETIEAIAVAGGFTQSALSSASYTINIPPPTFTFSLSPSSLTVNSGAQGSTTLTVTPQNGFNSAVTFACSGLPAGASCSFNPSSVTPAVATTQLTVTVSAQAMTVQPRPSPFFPATTIVAAACIFAFRRRRVLQIALALAVVVAGMGSLSGCGGGSGGGGGGGGTSPVTTTVTVTATSGTIQPSEFLTLTVN